MNANGLTVLDSLLEAKQLAMITDLAGNTMANTVALTVVSSRPMRRLSVVKNNHISAYTVVLYINKPEYSEAKCLCERIK